MTFLSLRILRLIAGVLTASDVPWIHPDSMRALAEIHRGRGELLSAMQYEEMADAREAVPDAISDAAKHP